MTNDEYLVALASLSPKGTRWILTTENGNVIHSLRLGHASNEAQRNEKSLRTLFSRHRF